jgi:hypothetical protein
MISPDEAAANVTSLGVGEANLVAHLSATNLPLPCELPRPLYQR